MADASKAILAQATGENKASSEMVKEASQAVFGGAVNLIKTADVSQKTGKVRKGESQSQKNKWRGV